MNANGELCASAALPPNSHRYLWRRSLDGLQGWSGGGGENHFCPCRELKQCNTQVSYAVYMHIGLYASKSRRKHFFDHFIAHPRVLPVSGLTPWSRVLLNMPKLPCVAICMSECALQSLQRLAKCEPVCNTS